MQVKCVNIKQLSKIPKTVYSEWLHLGKIQVALNEIFHCGNNFMNIFMNKRNTDIKTPNKYRVGDSSRPVTSKR